jgi:hypothetical protein
VTRNPHFCDPQFSVKQYHNENLSEKLSVVNEHDKEFDSPNAPNVTKTSRLRYAGHMIRRPEDLPQKSLLRTKPIGRRNQGRPKFRWADGVNSDSGPRGQKLDALCSRQAVIERSS